MITAKNFWLWFGGIWLVCGLPFLIIGLYAGNQRISADRRLAAEGRTVDGMVLTKAITYSSSSNSNRSGGSPTYRVTFRFRTTEGLISDDAEVSQETWDRLIEREPIQVTYVPDAPHYHRVEGQTGGWIMPTVMTVLGGIFTGLGGFILLRARSRRGMNTRLQREGMTTEAIVTEIRPARMRINGVPQWLVRYQYQDDRGQSRTGSEHLSPDEGEQWKVGDKATVRYDRKQPNQSLWVGKR
jgi:uncharacterized protein DUF3592